MAYPSAPTFLLARQITSLLHTSIDSLHEKSDSTFLSPASAGALPSSTSAGALPSPATIQTALILTAAGSLLAYESPLPVRTLRTYCSVAASLWTLHGATAPSVSVALDQPPQPQNITTTQSSSKAPAPPQQKQQPNYFQNQTQPPLPTHQASGDDDGYNDGSAPISIAASFKGGAVFVVRRLRCGLLFACSTPSPHSLTGSRPSTATVDPATVTALPVSVSSEDASASAAASESEPAAAAESATAATVTEPVSETAATEPATAPAAVGEPVNAPALKPAATSAPASTPGLPASAITTPSSLLRHSTQPLLHKPIPPAAPEPLDRAATPTPIAVPSKQPATDSGAGGLASSLVPGSAATAETYQTAHSGSEHANISGSGSGSGPDITADRDANADAVSLMTTGTNTTTGAGGSAPSASRSGKVSVAATLAVARRQVDELARMLDGKLGALELPEESIGWNGFCSVWTD